MNPVASPKFWKAKCLNLGEQHNFCLGRRFSKHNMTRYANNCGGHSPLDPLARLMHEPVYGSKLWRQITTLLV